MSEKSDKKKDKITMKRLISNVLYVIKYAFRHDSRLPLSYITSRCVFMGIGAFIDTFLLMEIINIFTTTADILSVVKVLAVMLILFAVRMVVFRLLENYFWMKMVGFEGKVQRELMEKAQKMDLKYYDIPEYYDDFVIAASQSEELCKKAIMSAANIISQIMAMLVAGTMILTVNAVIFIFPVIGFVVNIITRFIITK